MTGSDRLADLRVLVVGLGSIGLRHLENLRQLGCGHVAALRRRNGPLHNDVDLSGVPIYHDFDDAMDQGYHAVVISNPTSLHAEYAQRAAEAGCHLYIEKPLSHTLDNVDALARTVKDRGLTVTVGCQLRFHPNLVAVREWLQDEAIGRVLSVQADAGEYLPGWHPWEDYRTSYASREDLGGGVVLTTIHEIDYLYWLLGPFRAVFSCGGNSGALELDVEDHVTSVLVTESGAPVTLHLDYLQQPPSRKMKVVGTHGQVEWDYHQGVATLVLDGATKETSRLPRDWERNSLFLDIMSDFLSAVGDGRPTRVGLQDGIEALHIALDIKAQLRLEPAREPAGRMD